MTQEELELELLRQSEAQSNQEFINNSIPQPQNTAGLNAIFQTANSLLGTGFSTRNIDRLNREVQTGAEQNLKDQLDLQRADLEQQRKDEELVLRQQRQDLDAQLKIEKSQREQAKALREEQLNIAKIDALNKKANAAEIAATTKARREEVKAIKSPSQPERKGLFGFLQSRASNSLAGASKAQVTKAFKDPLDRVSKNLNKELQVTSKAQSALKILNEDPSKPVSQSTAKALQTILAKASGEVGNLTEAERAAFSGRQDILSVIQRKGSIAFSGVLPAKDRQALSDLARIYLSTSRERVRQSANSGLSEIRAGLGISNKELLNNGILDFFGRKFSGEDLGLVDADPEASPATQAAPQPSSPALEPDENLDSILDELGF